MDCSSHNEFFRLKDLPKELKDTDRHDKRIPPVFERQCKSLKFKIGRINVTGNGYCGYYVIQLLGYLNKCKIFSLNELENIRLTVLNEANISEDFVLAKRHYLEYLEVGVMLDKLVENLNIAVVVQSNVKKTGDKKATRKYSVQVASYKVGCLWSFILMSNGAKHYEVLTLVKNDKHCSVFEVDEAKKIFECCNSDYPEVSVYPEEQLVYLNADDLLYF